MMEERGGAGIDAVRITSACGVGGVEGASLAQHAIRNGESDLSYDTLQEYLYEMTTAVYKDGHQGWSQLRQELRLLFSVFL